MDAGDVIQLPNALFGSIATVPGPAGARRHARSPAFSDALFVRFEACARAIGTIAAGPDFQHRAARGGLSQFPGVEPGISVSLESVSGQRNGVLAIASRPSGSDHAGRLAFYYHAVFLNEDHFAVLDDQAFSLWRSGVFLDVKQWDRSDELPMIKLAREALRVPEIPHVSYQQAAAIEIELRHVLTGGSVLYESPEPDLAAEEHLRLVHLCLPRPQRRELAYCTFRERPTLEGPPPFRLCVQRGPNRFEPGRAVALKEPHRPPAADAETIDRYAARCRDALLGGDLVRLLQLGRVGLETEGPPASPREKGGNDRRFWLRSS